MCMFYTDTQNTRKRSTQLHAHILSGMCMFVRCLFLLNGSQKSCHFNISFGSQSLMTVGSIRNTKIRQTDDRSSVSITDSTAIYDEHESAP